MSLSRKLYFPKSLSFGAIRWSFLALASFIKRNSLRSIHSFSSWSPCASLHKSSSVHVPLRNLPETQGKPSERAAGNIHVSSDMQRSVTHNLTSHKLWKCLWEIDTASSSDHPQSWKLCLCVFLKWCAAATVSRCCSSYHTASSDCQPAKKTTHRVIAFTQMTNNRPFLNHRLFFITRKITRFYRNVDTVSSLGTNSFLLHRQIPTTKWFSTESNKYSC